MVAVSKQFVLLQRVFVLVVLIEVIKGHESPCSEHDEFRCSNGKCIPRSWFCNEANDCGDNSDEAYCRNVKSFELGCPGYDWRFCVNQGKCYPRVWKCDGITDCPDGSDEVACLIPNVQALKGVWQTHRSLTLNFLNRRQPKRSLNKWNPDLLKTAIALFLADKNFFRPGNQTGNEISYEVALQLLSKLAVKKKIPTPKLSFFISALTLTCGNPKDFFGVNLLAELGKRVDNDDHPNPFAILSLCNAGGPMTREDIAKLDQQLLTPQRPLWTDTQALISMAFTCISSKAKLYCDRQWRLEKDLIKKQNPIDGSFGNNLKTTALVVQALLPRVGHHDKLDVVLTRAILYMVRQINLKNATFDDMYYTLPILNSRTLVDIDSHHCQPTIKTDLEVLEELLEEPDPRIQIQCSMYLGDNVDFKRTWKLKVPLNYTFDQVLEVLGALEPSYKVQYSFSEGKRYVNGFNSVYDDADSGTFWFIYSRNISQMPSAPKLVKSSPEDIQVTDSEELILWYRSIEWADSSA